jgi:L-ribulokinase
VPKAWQIWDEDPAVYAAADRLLEGADWVVWQLTGCETRNSCTAGYKAIWSKREGFPPNEFYKALDPRLERLVDEKMSRTILPIGDRAGELTEQAAAWTGLWPGTAVAVANVDAHVSVPAATVAEPGRMVIIMGTSNCHMVLGTEERIVPGMCGYVEDGIIPGFFGYEAGQSCVGDHFAWFTENCVPAAYEREAASRSISIHQLLEEKAAAPRPGESGLLALDWWNGNRSVLVDVDLTGLLLGATLATRPEAIYRALIEATAYGTRIIIETFQNNGVPVHEIVATGGLPDRNKLLMQIYADVTGRPIAVAGTRQAGALGSAMFGAVAAGRAAGGYDTIFAATQRMARLRADAYTPNPEAKAVYDQLFAEYVTLYDYFGRGANDVMKRLKALKLEIRD